MRPPWFNLVGCFNPFPEKKYIHLNQSCQIWLNDTGYLKPPNQSVVSRIQSNRNYIITLNIRKRYPPVIKHGNGTSTIYRCVPPIFQLKPLSIHFQIATFDDTGLSIPLDCWFLKLPTMNLNRQWIIWILSIWTGSFPSPWTLRRRSGIGFS